uniref:Uncharacterized protein n=1 Tax=Helianthus annuus TaxID=4232 RepID=A0A251SHW8_HELAN
MVLIIYYGTYPAALSELYRTDLLALHAIRCYYFFLKLFSFPCIRHTCCRTSRVGGCWDTGWAITCCINCDICLNLCNALSVFVVWFVLNV